MSNYSGNVIEVNIQYEGNKAPDYKAIGEQINEHLKKHFKGQKIVVHPISGEEHPDRTIEDVLNHLLEHGTEKPEQKEKDKEQPGKENAYDFLGNYHEIHDKSDIMSAYAKDNQMEVDLIAVYDSEHVEKIPYSDKSQGIGDAYRFKQPDKKQAALKGVLKIIHEKKDAEEKQAEPEEKTAIKPKQGAKPEPEISEADIEQLAAQLGLDYQGAN
jgi:hypothetical protein